MWTKTLSTLVGAAMALGLMALPNLAAATDYSIRIGNGYYGNGGYYRGHNPYRYGHRYQRRGLNRHGFRSHRFGHSRGRSLNRHGFRTNKFGYPYGYYDRGFKQKRHRHYRGCGHPFFYGHH